MDELHLLVGAGPSAAAMLRPTSSSLPRLRELHAIGTSAVRESRQYIEKDAALERRFQPVYQNEPSLKETFASLRGFMDKHELHYVIRIM
jgi:ATP-dependent Clp protease ATP-binding subunit ClpB